MFITTKMVEQEKQQIKDLNGIDFPDIAMVPYRYEYLVHPDHGISVKGPPRLFKESENTAAKTGHINSGYKHYCLYTGKFCRFCSSEELDENIAERFDINI